MNYRHAYHAGNFADVMKHAILTLVLLTLRKKDKPFRVIDTHAGKGVYNLGDDEAQRTGEAQAGIVRLHRMAVEGRLPVAASILLEPYLAAVASFNDADAINAYPGSVALARHFLRPCDRLLANELHPDEAAALKTLFARDRQVKVMEQDAWQVIKAVLPPPERRGAVLIDPPFEEPGEFDRLAAGLASASRRFATGIYLLWYPLKDESAVSGFASAVRKTGLSRLLDVHLRVRRPGPGRHATGALFGSGLLIHNPPYGLADDLRTLLPALADCLSEERGGEGYDIIELAGEA